MRRALALLLGVLPLAGGAGAGELLVGTAVSLREPMTKVARLYEAEHPATRVRVSLGASNILAVQIRAGAPLDVFVSADEELVDGLQADGLVAARFALVRNRLVVIEAGDAEFHLEGPEDLARPEVRYIAIPEYAVPVGRYAREWLRTRGLLERLRERIVPTEHARATLAAVDYGHADAAIVYATDARVARSAIVAFAVAEEEQPRIVYAAARVSSTPAAREFMAFLRGSTALRAFEAAGFAAPGPAVAEPGP